ncbi:MAG TPA: hypothetical protein VN030_14320 [Cellvibrio sp.]|nr:hypothetical protein [Cellvibrio sp.]
MGDLYCAVAPKFRSRKAFVAYEKKIRDIKMARNHAGKAKIKIDQFLFDETDPCDYFFPAIIEFENLSFSNLFFLTGQCLVNNGWNLPAYQNSLLSLLLSYQLWFYNCEAMRLRFALTEPSKRINPIGIPLTFGNMICLMAVFGNKDLFVNTTNFCLDLFDRGLVGGDAIPLTQLFIMRLAERYLEVVERNWLADPYPWAVDPCEEEPLFEALMRHWDDENTNILEPLLVQLLNRHTFQASRNNKDGAKDFDGHTEQFPLELFFIYRLRHWNGLMLPSLKHPMIEPPFHELPTQLEQVIFENRDRQIMRRVRKIFPEFDRVVEEAKIRPWKMIL